MNWQSQQYEIMFDSVFESLQYARDEMVEGILAIDQICEEQIQLFEEQQARVIQQVEEKQAEREEISQKIFASGVNKDHIQLKNKEMYRNILEKKSQITQCKELSSEHLPQIIAEQEIQNYKAQKELAQFLILSELDLYTGRTESR